MYDKSPTARCVNCPKFLLENRGWLDRLLHGAQPIDRDCEGTVDLVEIDTIQAFGRFVGRSDSIITVCPKDVTLDVCVTNKEQVKDMDELYKDTEERMRKGEYVEFSGGLDSFVARSINTVE